MEGISKMIIPVEEVDLEEIDNQLDEQAQEALEEIDNHLDRQAQEAQDRYDRFDEEMLKGSSDGKLDSRRQGNEKEYSGRMDGKSETEQAEDGKSSRRMETELGPRSLKNDMMTLRKRWEKGEYNLVVEKMKLMEDWPEEASEIKEAIVAWMAENEVINLVEEGEDILDGLEAMNADGTSGVTDAVLMDATEIVTTKYHSG